jgi:hypothetical protein
MYLNLIIVFILDIYMIEDINIRSEEKCICGGYFYGSAAVPIFGDKGKQVGIKIILTCSGLKDKPCKEVKKIWRYFKRKG